METGALAVAIGALLATLSYGCGATHQGASVGRAAARSSSSATTAPSHLPNPFSVVARYSASSLGLKNPRDLAIGPNGDIYVTEAADRVTVLSPTGKILRRWGKRGHRPGEFNFVPGDPRDPAGVSASIAVGSGGNVYVSDSGNHRVEVFSSNGRFVRDIGSFGYGNGQFQFPTDLTGDAAGDVYVADDAAETLSKFSASGRFEWTIGGASSRDPDLLGHFHSPNVDAHNRVVAAVDDAHSVVYLDAAGHKVDAFSTRGYFHNDWGPCSATLTPAGDTVVESCPGGPTGKPGPPYLATLVFDPTHRLVGAWYHSPFATDVPPRFGPHGESFALASTTQVNGITRATGGSILKLKVKLPEVTPAGY
jgi:hypothetical protein